MNPIWQNPDALLTMAVALGALILFVTEIVTVDVVGLLVLVTLIAGGVLEPSEGLSGFASEALVTIVCMFILSAGMIRAGALEVLTSAMEKVGKGSQTRMIIALLVTVAVSSAFVNNTPVAVIFLPVVLSISARLNLAPSKLLIPMSYASILGGTCTLIGTSTNLLVSEAAHQHGFPAIGIFEFTIPGLIFALIGFLFLALFGSRLLPQRESVSSTLAAGKIREFVTEILFTEDSPFVGKSYQEVLGKAPGLTPLMVTRGDEIHMAPLVRSPATQFIRGGDVLMLKGDPGSINAMLEKDGVTLPPELGEVMASGKGRTLTMVELVVQPNSPLIGRTIAGAEFSKKYGNASPIAILRRDAHIRERITNIRLRLGDTLLVVVDEGRLEDLRDTPSFIMLEGTETRVVRRDKAKIATSVMIAVIVLAALGTMPISVLAMAGVTCMVLTDCIPIRLAYRAIDMSLVILIGGMLALGLALEKTGLVHLLSTGMVDILQDFGPRAVLAGIYILAALLTSLVSNNAVAVILTPVALDIGVTMGLSPYPFLFAVLFGASACFSTPIGYQTNLFVYGPGGYRFTDYIRIGLPLTVLLFIAALFVIPWFWPLVAINS